MAIRFPSYIEEDDSAPFSWSDLRAEAEQRKQDYDDERLVFMPDSFDDSDDDLEAMDESTQAFMRDFMAEFEAANEPRSLEKMWGVSSDYEGDRDEDEEEAVANEADAEQEEDEAEDEEEREYQDDCEDEEVSPSPTMSTAASEDLVPHHSVPVPPSAPAGKPGFRRTVVLRRSAPPQASGIAAAAAVAAGLAGSAGRAFRRRGRFATAER